MLFEEPNSNRAKLEMGRAYFMQKSFGEAKNILKKLYNDNQVPVEVKNNIKKYLDVIDKNSVKHSVDGLIIVGMNYDSNINSKSQYDTFNNVYLPAFNSYLDMDNTTKDDTAWAYQGIVIANHNYKINDTTINKNTLMVFSKRYTSPEYKIKNTRLISYSPSVNVVYDDKLSINYGIFADKMYLDMKSYMKTYGITPSFTYKYSDLDIVSGYFKHQTKVFQQSENKPKNSRYIDIGTTFVHNHANKFISSYFIGYSNEKKKIGIQEGVDNSVVSLKTGFTYMYSQILTLNPSISFKQTKYADVDSNYLVKKKNNEYKLDLTLTYVYSPKFILQSGVNYTKQSSNIQPDEYKKYAFMFNFIRPF